MWSWTVRHDSLRLRLLLAIVGGVAVISGAAMVLDYSREYRLGLDRIIVSLDEQAALRTQLAWRLVFVLLLTLAIITFVYLAVSRWVVKPLDTLVTSARQSLHEQARMVIQAVAPTNGDRQRDDMTVLALQFDPESNARHI